MIAIFRAYCDECLTTCTQAKNHATGELVHAVDILTLQHELTAAGYYYAGRVGPEFRWHESFNLANNPGPHNSGWMHSLIEAADSRLFALDDREDPYDIGI